METASDKKNVKTPAAGKGQTDGAGANGRNNWRDAVRQPFSSLLMPEHAAKAQESAPKPTPSQFAPEYYDAHGLLKQPQSIPNVREAALGTSHLNPGNSGLSPQSKEDATTLKLAANHSTEHSHPDRPHSGHPKQRPSRLKPGLSLDASDALRGLGITADRIVQTIGHARASVGFHAKDGDDVDGRPYTAAVDISTRIGNRHLSDKEIAQLIDRLGRAGFAAWYRKPGHDGWPVAPHFEEHIHAVYAGVKMKDALEKQIQDYRQNRTGLQGHQAYHFSHFSPAAESAVQQHFLHRRKR